MRSRYVRAMLGILVLVVFGTQLFTSTITAIKIEASVDVKPETFNLKENGVITALVGFFDSQYNVSDIDLESIELHVVTAVGSIEPLNCVIADDKLVAKFDASEVADLIRSTLGHMQPTPPKAEYVRTIVVKGTVNGVDFEGSDDQVKVILP